jgi:hypothetical protein
VEQAETNRKAENNIAMRKDLNRITQGFATTRHGKGWNMLPAALELAIGLPPVAARNWGIHIFFTCLLHISLVKTGPKST